MGYPAPFRALTSAFKDHYSSEMLKYPSWTVNLRRLQHRSWALNNLQLRLAFEQSLIDLPDVSSRYLEKLDRGNKLAKAFALLQIIYLIIELTARKIANLPSTQLEIATLAYSLSSMITYVLYWSRPQGVESLHIIKAKKMPNVDTIWNMINYVSNYMWTLCRCENGIDTELDLVPLPNDSGYVLFHALDGWLGRVLCAAGFNKEALPLAYGVVAGSSLFGGLHCLAWRFRFPTSEEALAWKICSILTTCLPILSIAPFVAWQRRILPVTCPPKPTGSTIKYLAGLSLAIILVTYILARLFLLIEIFRSLLFLPPEAFINTWSRSFPHFTG